MNSKTVVIKNSILYTFSSLLVKAFSFFLIPLYTHYLSTEQYGIINLVNSFTSVALYIVGFSLYTAIVRFYFDYSKDRKTVKQYFGTILFFVFFSNVFFIFLFFLFRDELVNLFFEGVSFFPYVFLSLASILFITFQSIHQSILRAIQKGTKLTIVNIVFFAIQAFLNILFLVVFEMEAVGILLSILIVNSLYFGYMIIDLLKNDLISFSFKPGILIPSLKYSIPIIPHDLSTHIASFASKILINKNESTAEVGIYGLASQFGGIIDIIQSSVNSAFQPWLYENISEENETLIKQTRKMSKGLLIAYSLFYVSLSLFSQEIIMIFSSSGYHRTWTVIPIIVLAYSIKSIYYFYLNMLLFHKKATKFLFYASVIGSLVDIFLAFFLVPLFGIYGSAISFLAAKIVLVIIVHFVCRRYNSVNYRILDFLYILIPSYFFIFIGLFFNYLFFLDAFSWFNFLYKIVVLFLFVIYTLFVNRKILFPLISSLINSITRKHREKKANRL